MRFHAAVLRGCSPLRKASQSLQLPLALLVVILQRAPQLPTALFARLSQPIMQIAQKAFVTAASLGSVHAVSGQSASKYTVNDSTYTIGVASITHGETTGVGESLVLRIGNNFGPLSWTLDTGTLPPGFSVTDSSQEVVMTDGMINATFISVRGTPSASGNYVFSLTPWGQLNGGGQSAPTPLQIALAISPSSQEPGAPPDFTYSRMNDTLRLTWNSAEAFGYRLRQSDNLLEWTNVTQQPTSSNGESSVILPIPDSAFFRFELEE